MLTQEYDRRKHTLTSSSSRLITSLLVAMIQTATVKNNIDVDHLFPFSVVIAAVNSDKRCPSNARCRCVFVHIYLCVCVCTQFEKKFNKDMFG